VFIFVVSFVRLGSETFGYSLVCMTGGIFLNIFVSFSYGKRWKFLGAVSDYNKERAETLPSLFSEEVRLLQDRDMNTADVCVSGSNASRTCSCITKNGLQTSLDARKSFRQHG